MDMFLVYGARGGIPPLAVSRKNFPLIDPRHPQFPNGAVRVSQLRQN
jgi:hypothetical protein